MRTLIILATILLTGCCTHQPTTHLMDFDEWRRYNPNAKQPNGFHYFTPGSTAPNSPENRIEFEVGKGPIKLYIESSTGYPATYGLQNPHHIWNFGHDGKSKDFQFWPGRFVKGKGVLQIRHRDGKVIAPKGMIVQGVDLVAVVKRLTQRVWALENH